MGSLWKYVMVGVLCFVLGSAVIVSAQGATGFFITNQDETKSVGIKNDRLKMHTTGKIRIANADAIRGADGIQGLAGQDGAQGPAGLDGADGAPGPAGPAGGLSGIVNVEEESTLNSITPKIVTAVCPAGTVVIGGGGLVIGVSASVHPMVMQESREFGGGWRVKFMESAAFALDWKARAVVKCANVS